MALVFFLRHFDNSRNLLQWQIILKRRFLWAAKQGFVNAKMYAFWVNLKPRKPFFFLHFFEHPLPAETTFFSEFLLWVRDLNLTLGAIVQSDLLFFLSSLLWCQGPSNIFFQFIRFRKYEDNYRKNPLLVKLLRIVRICRLCSSLLFTL